MPFINVPYTIQSSNTSFRPCDTASRPLPPGSILHRLLLLQRHTDMSDHDAKTVCDRLLGSIDDLDGLHR